ncbi:unnamed protein product [Amoebophrya sp. A25]|nr:unnamed protein product [Amoebophrya sp. A25]|eukprot:GSA25T00024933001.1
MTLLAFAFVSLVQYDAGHGADHYDPGSVSGLRSSPWLVIGLLLLLLVMMLMVIVILVLVVLSLLLLSHFCIRDLGIDKEGRHGRTAMDSCKNTHAFLAGIVTHSSTVDEETGCRTRRVVPLNRFNCTHYSTRVVFL